MISAGVQVFQRYRFRASCRILVIEVADLINDTEFLKKKEGKALSPQVNSTGKGYLRILL